MERFPSDEELAEALGMKVDQMRSLLKSSHLPISLYGESREQEVQDLSEIIADETTDVYGDVEHIWLAKTLKERLNGLKPEQKQAICLRYGLEGGREHTLEEIGKILGTSRETIRKHLDSARLRLKNDRRFAEELSDYL